MENIFGLTLDEITERMARLGEKPYRAAQIAEWMYKKGSSSFLEMTSLPVTLRERLAKMFSIDRASLVTRLDSADGSTTKFLLGFADGVAVEAVLMRQPYGASVCLSTQAGCAMGCAFCASTLSGLTRDLTAGEILAELSFIAGELRHSGDSVSSIVLMGSGEPLMNYENVMRFIRLIHEPYCLGMSYRSMTLSTSGIIPAIRALAREDIPLTLSISLHAADDATRSRLMPVNRRYPLSELITAGGDYAKSTGRRVTYEYILIGGVNDSDDDAALLARLLRGQLAMVNLIPINPVDERMWQRPAKRRVERFLDVLSSLHVNATVRREMGSDIGAACGQLRSKYLNG